ncbi:hypothetical protein AAMO2058_001026900 [Amorphochlora amoebiformis]
MIRLLRPLRTISSVRGMRYMVASLGLSIPRLSGVLLLLMFAFIVFGVVGMQYFGGRFRYRCVNSEGESLKHRFCGPEYGCPLDYNCVYTETNPNRGVTGFDNTAQAWLTILQCMSLEGWYEVSVYAMESTSVAAIIYFIALIVLCSFFIANLVVAIVFAAYKKQRRVKDKGGYRSTKFNERLKQINQQIRANQILQNLTSKSRKERRQSIDQNDSKGAEKLENNFRLFAKANQAKHRESLSVKRGFVELSRLQRFMFYIGSKCGNIARGRWFKEVAMGAIIINTGLLASEHYGQNQVHTQTLRISNFILTAIFTLEIIIKVIGIPWREFISDGFNQFDALIVALSVVEIALVETHIISSSGISAFRAFRLLRVFRLAKQWKQLNRLLDAIGKSLRSLTYFSLLLLLFIFMFGLIGLQFFAGKLKDSNGEVSRANFDNVGWAMVTVFQIIGGEGWQEILYDATAECGWYAAIYFSVLYVFGHYVLLSLFLGILLSHFEQTSNEAEATASKFRFSSQRIPTARSLKNIGGGLYVPRSRFHNSILQSSRSPHAMSSRKENSTLSIIYNQQGSPIHNRRKIIDTPTNSKPEIAPLDAKSVDSWSPTSLIEESKKKRRTSLRPGRTRRHSLRGEVLMSWHGTPSKSRRFKGGGTIQIKPPSKQAETKFMTKKGILWVGPSNPKLIGNSLGVFSPNHRLRLHAERIYFSRWFHILTFSTVLIAAIVLPISITFTSTGAFISFWSLEVVIAIVFIFEITVKCITYGLFTEEIGYLKSYWNWLSAAVCVGTVLDVLLTPWDILGDWNATSIIRALRALRVIEFISSMKLVAESLVSSTPEITKVFLVSCLFHLIFGILGVQLFGGMLYQCQKSDRFDLDVLDLNENECVDISGYTWSNPYYANFDNIGTAVLTLFEVSSLEGWPRVMHRAVDIDGPGKAPKRDNQQIYALYFVAFIVVGSFLVNNLFVGVVIRSFKIMREHLEGSSMLSEVQRLWLEVHHNFLFVRLKAYYQPPVTAAKSEAHLAKLRRRYKENFMKHSGKRHRSLGRLPSDTLPVDNLQGIQDKQYWTTIRTAIFYAVISRWFKLTVNALVCASVAILLMNYEGAPVHYANGLEAASLTLTILFAAEATLKLIGLGLNQYFSSRWNIFDFTVALGSICSAIVKSYGSDSLSFFLLLRVFRLIKVSDTLKQMVSTVAMASQPLANVGGLLLLVVFVYAIVGMQLFAFIPHDGELLSRSTNFDSFPIAFLTLFRCATGEDWNSIMHACAPREMKCPDGAVNCGKYASFPFFISYVVVVQFMMLNLFVAVVLEFFHSAKEAEKTCQFIDINDLNMFSRLWSKYIVLPPWWRFWETTQYWVTWEAYCKVMVELGGNLALGSTRKERYRELFHLEVPVYSRYIATLENKDGITLYSYEKRYCVHYYDGIIAAVLKEFERKNEPVEQLLQIPKFVHKYQRLQHQLNNRFGKIFATDAHNTLHEILAAQRIQSAWRGFRSRSLMRREVKQRRGSLEKKTRSGSTRSRSYGSLEKKRRSGSTRNRFSSSFRGCKPSRGANSDGIKHEKVLKTAASTPDEEQTMHHPDSRNARPKANANILANFHREISSRSIPQSNVHFKEPRSSAHGSDVEEG